MKAWICFYLAFHTPIDRVSYRLFLWLVSHAEIYGRCPYPIDHEQSADCIAAGQCGCNNQKETT